MLSVSLITLGDPEQLTGGYLYHRRMAELAPEHDARVRFASFPEHMFPLPAVHADRVMRAALEPPVDVLLLDSIAAAYAAPWLARHRLDRPLVAILHQPPGGIDHGRPRRLLQAALDRAAYRHARLLVLASALLTGQLPAGYRRRQLLVVPPGRDVAAVAGNPPGDLRQGRRAALLCVGNWVERKGILELLEAFAPLPPDAATLHLAGSDTTDPAYATRVRARLARPDLHGRVVTHGPLDREQVAGLYAGADAFVLASTREPYGTVYGEAMAAGLPVVGWRAGNLPHLAAHDLEGLLLSPGDLEGLTDALRRLAADEAYRRRLGEAARAKAAGFPTWSESAALLFGTLREVVATSAPPVR